MCRKHRFARLGDVRRMRDIIERSALCDIDKQIISMVHISHSDEDLIGDTVGLSRSQVGRRYHAALEIIDSIY